MIVRGAHAPFLHAQHPVEVARREHRVLVEALDAPAGRADGEQQRSDRENDEYRMRAPDLPCEQRRTGNQSDRKLEVRRQEDRSEKADQDGADRAAQRDHQIEAREVARRGLEPRKLAVAEHAGKEQSGAEHADLQGKLVGELAVGEGPAHHAQSRRQHRAERGTVIPAGTVEAQDEGEQVNRRP